VLDTSPRSQINKFRAEYSIFGKGYTLKSGKQLPDIASIQHTTLIALSLAVLRFRWRCRSTSNLTQYGCIISFQKLYRIGFIGDRRSFEWMELNFAETASNPLNQILHEFLSVQRVWHGMATRRYQINAPRAMRGPGGRPPRAGVERQDLSCDQL